MSQIRLDHAAFTKAIADVREAAGQLRQDRARIDDRVSAFLGDGWTGVAADSFVDAWGDWKAGATDVLEGLVAMAELMQATHQDLTDRDGDSAQTMNHVSSKIIERLG